MIKRIFLCLIVGALIGCNSMEKKSISKKDSADILVTALNSKSFLKGNILYGDSIYFIKSTYYIKEFPTESAYFKIFYIDNSDENRKINFPGVHNEKRNIYEITKFKAELDSANIALYNPQARESYVYKLERFRGYWRIKKEESFID